MAIDEQGVGGEVGLDLLLMLAVEVEQTGFFVGGDGSVVACELPVDSPLPY